MAKEKSMKLNVWAFGVALGSVWGIAMLVAGWTSIFGWGTLFVNTMSSVYLGYIPSFGGGIVGGIWGFVDGFIGGTVFAFFYNLIVSRK
jgi:fluoride ion exporter CrcB/FEX